MALTILGSLATVGLFLAWMLLVYKAAMDMAGPHATQAQIEQAMQGLLTKGFIPHSQTLKTGALLATFANIGGVVIAARSLARRESGRGMAIAACIVGGLFLLCQMLLTMSLLGPRPPA